VQDESPPKAPVVPEVPSLEVESVESSVSTGTDEAISSILTPEEKSSCEKQAPSLETEESSESSPPDPKLEETSPKSPSDETPSSSPPPEKQSLTSMFSYTVPDDDVTTVNHTMTSSHNDVITPTANEVNGVNQLNKSITEAPKTPKTTPVVGVGKAASLNDRLAKYNQASKQETKRTPSTTPKVIASKDMKSVKNRWENAVNTTTNVKKMTTPVAGNLASRKDMWESGKVQNSTKTPVKKLETYSKTAPQFSSLKDQYLQKAASNTTTAQKKNNIVTSQNVGNSLSKWESRSSAQVQ